MSTDKTIQLFDPSTVTLEDSNLIEASAGTGKTYSIAILTLRLVLEKKIPIQQVLMVTFTKAAVAELETRIRQFMRKALKVSQGLVINDDTITNIVKAAMEENKTGAVETNRLLKEAVLFLDETSILTIHSFCQRILTEFAFETSQVFGSDILTDLAAIITDRVNAFWRKHITTIQTGLLKEMMNAGISRSSLINLMSNSLSGKSITPGEKPAADFLSAEHQSEIYTTVHALEQKKENILHHILQSIISDIEVIRLATEKNSHASKNMLHLLNDPEALLHEIVANKDKAYVQKVYKEILEQYEKITIIDEEKKIVLGTVVNLLYNYAIEIITAEINLYKQQNNQVGFDDMINKIHKAVVVDNKETLINALQQKYKAAFIDEFQDTDKVQYEIFNRLFSNHTVLFYIGDPKQSIYAWRKADLFTYFKAGDAVTNRFEMDVNYRSSKRFIEAMNIFFLPIPGFDTFHFSGEAKEINYTIIQSPSKSAKGELLKDGQQDTPITIYENATNGAITQTVAAQIIELLEKDYTIEEKGAKRKIRPSDIGILVRRNDQGKELKQLLSKYGIPAVTIDDTKLLQSDEAGYLQYLLAAVIDINSSNINKALLSPLTGFSVADILAMNDELALNRFKNYQHLWEHEGVYVMLTRFIADYKVRQVLLQQTQNGERIITNILQLMEVLHKMQTQKQFSPLELANWLKRGIEGMEVSGDEFEQRVESDEEAVKIVTIHKSKGLEYNIVFAPFLDLAADPRDGFVTFRDAASGDYLFSEKSSMNEGLLQLTKKQLEQENRRLVYVAITRAVYKCYINKNTGSRYNLSSVTPFINAQKQNGSPLTGFELPPALPADYRYATTLEELPPAYLQATNFKLTEYNWRKLSYTYLDPGHRAIYKGNTARALDEYDAFIFKELKRGANTGNLLHAIFERINFADNSSWPMHIETALKRFIPNPSGKYATQLLALLDHVILAKLTVADTVFSLNELHRDKKINELEFDFNVTSFSPEEMNHLSATETPFQIRYAKELEGIMNGKIDLFFEHDGKFFILDWKSNYLGDKPGDYSEENVRAAMAESNYHLQYLIYTVAVKKYLQLRKPGFDYKTHFGGVIYLFVRGIRKDKNQGIFTHKPSGHLIDELEKILSGKVTG